MESQLAEQKFTMADGRPYMGENCLNHGKDAKGNKIKVKLQKKTVTRFDKKLNQDREMKIAHCPKCFISFEIKTS